MAIVATATKKANITEGVQGGWISWHQANYNPASLAAATQIALDFTVAGVKTGDLVLCQVEGLPYGLVLTGAKVTGADIVTAYLNNYIDATTAVDAPAVNFDFVVVHLT